jgi:predicted house-cleaning noncanonical NTP pyrophosphatase (MazG superfamily)
MDTATPNATTMVRDADALIALLDHMPASAAAAIAYAFHHDKPVLGLATKGAPIAPIIAEMVSVVAESTAAAWLEALPAFYDDVRPYAGRVVRDRIPDLVREAGHHVTFRQLTAEERPRFLKQKVASEARELLASPVGKEKEQVADVLEALEAFITSRDYGRDDLRRVKEHKRKQRGAFERCFVVESTAAVAGLPTARAEEAGNADRPTTPEVPPDAQDPGFEYPEDPIVEPVDHPDGLQPGKDVRAEFFEI